MLWVEFCILCNYIFHNKNTIVTGVKSQFVTPRYQLLTCTYNCTINQHNVKNQKQWKLQLQLLRTPNE